MNGVARRRNMAMSEGEGEDILLGCRGRTRR